MVKHVSLISLTLITIFVHAMPAVAAPVVLFDESHAQQFLIGRDGPLDLSGLAGACQENGLQVQSSTRPLNSAELAAVDVLVISGPFKPLAADELEAVLNFIRNGGGLAVMLHIAPPVFNLLRQLDVEVANAILREDGAAIDGNPLYFTVSRLATHPVTAGLESFSIYGGWALRGATDNVKILAATSERGWVDLDHDERFSAADAMQSFGVVVAGQLGQGRFVVFGDDALFQNRFFDQPNRQLAVNLVNWLSGK